MGTCYKGNSKTYRSIGQNVMIASSSYNYKDGYFGEKSPSTGSKTRNITSTDNIATARDFYNKIAYGGTETSYKNGSMKITHMADGSIITWRLTSHSDGTSVVEINISSSSHTGGIKQQKIHFIKE